MNRVREESLGIPSLQLDALRIWVHGRQFPDSLDFWDGNWLNITANCASAGSSVWISGPRIHLSELETLYNEATRLYDTLTGEAALKCLEPELNVLLKAKSLGHIAVTVQITPDHLNQSHRFLFEVDQTYLPAFLGQLKTTLVEYPIRDPQQQLPVGSVTHS
jgi:hypothetical protein